MSSADIVHSIQGAAESWKAFDWGGKLAQVEETLSSQKEARDQSLAARKKLADATKQFRKSVKTLQQAAESLQAETNESTAGATVTAVDAVAKECKSIVNSYKEEIDNLTRRCKSSDTAYSTFFQPLAELQDPGTVLAVSSEQLLEQQAQMTQLLQTVEKLSSEMERQQENHQKELATAQQKAGNSGMSKQDREELIQLRREVAEYEVEFRSLKNQDITIRKLESRISELQKAGEQQLQDELEKAKEELAETEGRRAAEALEREAAMERKVQTLELQLKAERAGREATQAHMLEADEGVSRREAAWEAQRQIIISDSDRLREELQIASRERDELRLQVSALQGAGEKMIGSSSEMSSGVSMDDLMAERAAYQTEVAELSETAMLLREELQAKEDAILTERRENQIKVDSLEREKNLLQNNLMSLETQLAAAPSQSMFENMKRELRILKRLEYNADDIDVDKDPEIAGGDGTEEKELEAVLVSKLRRAETDLISERNARKELSEELEKAQQKLGEAEKGKEEAEKLVSSLEKDLAQAIATPPVPTERKAMEVIPTAENPATLQNVLDPDAPPLPEAAKPAVSVSASEKAQDDHSVATIVMAQRDRLRARCDALEAERDSFRRELQAQVQATESLKADNTKLYEKMRYLQSYNKGPSSRSAKLDRDLDLEALEQRYEASVDPFRQFSKAERQRKLNEMSPTERAVFVVAKTVLATKEMRTALFFYVLVLHMLVFVTTYHWSHADGCSMMDHDHLAHLPPNAASHIREDLQAKGEGK